MGNPVNRADKKTAMIMLRVDGWTDGAYVGTVASPHFREPIPFRGLDRLVLMLDQLFDQIKYPQAAFEVRHFPKAEGNPPLLIRPIQEVPSHNDYVTACGRGSLCTFFITVIARQNASWQGEVAWVEQREKIPFRSALELMRLIDEAARQPKIPSRRKTLFSDDLLCIEKVKT